MRKLDNQYLIEQYYEEVKEEYPHIDFEEVKKIVSSPFIFLKEQMATDALPTIRLKYFGTFVVYDERAKAILERTEQQYAKGSITKKLYEHRKKMIHDFLIKRTAE